MYDELVKRLKNCATQAAPCLTCGMTDDGSCIETLMKQAADAIEKLQQIAAHYEETAHDYFKDVCYYLERMPNWIPVTERLPGAEQVLINLQYPDGENEVSLGEHWNCPNIQQEDGWGGFGGNGVVTHWMPLPKPPKEE